MTITRRSSTILAYAVGGTLFAAALYLSFELGRYREAIGVETAAPAQRAETGSTAMVGGQP